MKFLHLADLHLGKLLHGHSLIEDQRYWIGQLLDYIRTERPDAVLIAGDVYDRGVPPKEAVPLLSGLLTGIADLGIPVLLIAGNHDGGERLSFGAELFSRQNVHIAGRLTRELKKVTLADAYGPVNFWLLPYFFPASVRDVLGLSDQEVPDYTEAARRLLAAQKLDPAERNVILAHQFVLTDSGEPERGGSESTVGGVGGISAAVFDAFDYAALGHIHRAQAVGRETVRYAGAPLCYHFSEVGQTKGPLMVELGAKGTAPLLRQDTLPVLHPARQIAGHFAEIVEAEKQSPLRNEYLRVVLTDRTVPPDAQSVLRDLFESHGSRLLDIAREPERGDAAERAETAAAETRSLTELFSDFYCSQRNTAAVPEDAMALVRFAAQQVLDGQDLSEEEAAQQIADFALSKEV